MSIHVLKATSAPTTAPTRSGVHYIDTLAKKHYFSVGTATVADWVEIGTGSGGGTSGGDAGINHILRGSADSGIDGWNLYKDAAGALPVDATQGGNLASITFTQNTTSPLRGTADFRLTKPASNVQGEGVSYDFTIPRADLGKVQTISFEYEIVSGTFSTGDLTVYIIQDTAGTPTVIQPSGFRIEAVGGTTKGRFIGVFQTHASVLNYRLAFHVATTSALAYTLGIDRISVGPQTVQYGPAVTEWKDFPSVAAGTLITATTTSPTFGTATVNKAQWRQVGTDMEIRWDYAQTTAGTAGSGTYLFNLPAGYSIDTTKVSVSASADLSKSLGRFDYQDGVAVGTGYVIAHSATQLRMVMQVNNGTAAYSTGTVSSVYGQLNLPTVTYSIRATVPIQGFGGTVQFSNDTDTRVVAAKIIQTASQSITNNVVAKATNMSPEFDRCGLWNSSLQRLVIQSPGTYRVTAACPSLSGSGDRLSAMIYKNGALALHWYIPGTAVGAANPTGSGLMELIAGDYLELYVGIEGASRSTNPGTGNFYLAVERLSGPSAIAPSDIISARYASATGQTLGASGSLVIIDFSTRVSDSHGSVTTGAAWKFTAQSAGEFLVTCGLAATFSAAASKALRLYRNGAYYSVLDAKTADSFMGGATLVKLLAGEYIDIRHIWSGSGTASLSANSTDNHISVLRVGNY